MLCNLRDCRGQRSHLCGEWAFIDCLPCARYCWKCFTHFISFNPLYTYEVGTTIDPISILWSWNRELTWVVDPRFEPRLPDSTAFNDSVIVPLVLVSGLLAAGPASDRVLWTSSQRRGRFIVLGGRILPSYSAGSPIHLIKGAPQNLKAFGDSRNVLYLLHIDPINAFWGYLKHLLSISQPCKNII